MCGLRGVGEEDTEKGAAGQGQKQFMLTGCRVGLVSLLCDLASSPLGASSATAGICPTNSEVPFKSYSLGEPDSAATQPLGARLSLGEPGEAAKGWPAAPLSPGVPGVSPHRAIRPAADVRGRLVGLG